MKEEIWKDIKGFEGTYQVSSLGRVKSLERYVYGRTDRSSRIHKERILRPGLTDRGYLQVRLSLNNKSTSYSIHKLTAIAFIANKENKLTINHINGIKTDNRVSNLEWSTHSENIKHAFETGLSKAPNGERNGLSKLNSTQVIDIRNSNERSTVLAKIYNVTRSNIYAIRKRKSWFHI